MTPAIMIDLETLGNKPTAAIASISAVLFDPRSDWLGDEFHMHVSLESCQRAGLKMGVSTVLWWLQQNDDARQTLIAGQTDAAPLVVALDALAAFIPEGAEPWCNGNSFDFAILHHAYDLIGMATPWAFYEEMDLRTLKRLNKGMRLERSGTHHNALDDARHQAKLVQHILQANPDMDA